MNLNSFIFKYFVYYPITLLRLEFPYLTLKNLRKTQYYSIESIQEIQLRKLSKLIKHAKKTTGFYKDRLPEDIASLDDITLCPILDKDQLRNNQEQFISSKFCGLTASKTSGGSTGAPVTIVKNNFGMANEFAATWRGYEWAGIAIGDKQARFWGVPMNNKALLKSKLIDFVTNRFRLSAFSFSENDLERYTQSLTQFKPIYFYGYVSMIKEFSLFVKRKNYEHLFDLKCIITTSEVLTDDDKQFISDVFKCPVFNEYGCGEIGTIAHECEKGNLHISAENMIVEILDPNGKSVEKGESGEIVVTDLVNYSMPLIRYRMKDFGSISKTSCPCGRGLPIIEKVHGRSYDMLVNKAGKKFHGEFFLYMIEDIKRTGVIINGYQVEQTAVDKILISLVSTDQDFETVKILLTQKIRANFDREVNLEFLKKDFINREKSGKLRVIKGMESNL